MPGDRPTSTNAPDEATLFVVDGDRGSCDLVRDLAHTMHLRCEVFASGREFLAASAANQPGCAVLEIALPDTSGLEVQQRLTERGQSLPLIFLTRQANLSFAIQAMRAGAVHFLEKPLRTHELWDAIQEALAVDRQRRRAEDLRRQVHERLALLDGRERQVLDMLGQGKSNKEIAADLQLSVRTVEVRRRALGKKLQVRSPLELIYYAVLATRGADGSRRSTR